MKTRFYLIYFLIVPLLLLFACGGNTQKQQMDNQGKKAMVFDNPKDAVNKAREDMLAVLKQDANINLGVSAAALEKSRPGETIKQKVLNFSELLNADTTKNIFSFVQGEENDIIPFVTENMAVTVVELAKVEGGWSVAALGSKAVTEELNEVMRVAAQYGPDAAKSITIYLIPNLKSHIYGVMVRETEIYFTNYSSRFSLQKPAKRSELIMALVEDSKKFQREFGDRIQKEQLTD